jgi:hypothetical protein
MSRGLAPATVNTFLPGLASEASVATLAIVAAAEQGDCAELGADINFRSNNQFLALRGLSDLLQAFVQMDLTPQSAGNMLESLSALLEQQAEDADVITRLCDVYVTRCKCGDDATVVAKMPNKKGGAR